MQLDCLIVGGGPAGLTAAIYLGRYRRKVLLIDNGGSRAAKIPKTHNYPGFIDGVSGAELLRLLHEQSKIYGAEISEGSVVKIAPYQRGFSVMTEKDSVTASRVLLATGLKDRVPEMPAFTEASREAFVRYCPICDAYEAIDRKIAVYGPLPDASAKALFLRTYSPDITLLPFDERQDATSRRELECAQIAIAEAPPSHFEAVEGGLVVHLKNGTRLGFDVLYPSLGCEVHSTLATNLGARTNDIGCLLVNDKQETSVAGIYAAGDVVSDLHQISVAASHACVAATAIHRSLPKNYRS
jgi:thioredoxin reductase (NADPH)